MKNFISTSLLLIILNICHGQAPPSLIASLPPLDQSPLDMAYFPDNFPMLKTQDKVTQPLAARVIYSRPQKNNRVIFGDLIEYGKVWRLGANEATEIEFFKDVTIGSKKITKGRYTIYAIPNPGQWTIIINKDTYTWGAFIYNDKKDILRINEPAVSVPVPVEAFTMHFDKTATGANLVMVWDTTTVTLPIGIK